MRRDVEHLMLLIVVVGLLLVLNGCAVYHSTPVTDAVNDNEIRVGMSRQEAHKILGDANEVAKRKVNGGTREVWTYYEYDPNLRGCTLTLLSCSSGIFVPVKPKLQYVIFYNEKLTGWNLPDPFQKSPTVEDNGR